MAEPCPKCGYAEVETDTCPRCRVIVPKYRVYLESGIYQQSLGKGVRAPRTHPAPKSSPPPPQVTKTGAPSRPAPPSRPGPTPAEPGASRVRQLSFHGTGGSLFGIQVVNMLLTVVTLGIYNFWGRVRVRRYLLSQTEFEGDRFAYHGTGKDLLIGFLKAVVVFGVPVVALNILPDLLGGGPAIKLVAQLLLYGLILIFIPIAIVGALRYRLSRTSWRGIRLSFRGPALEFVKLFVIGSVLTIVTLGFYSPFFAVKRYGFLVSHAYFGNQRFDFDGTGKDLFRAYLLAVLLTLPTLGLYWFWYLAKKQNYLLDRTSFGTARFHAAFTGGGLFLLLLGNLLLVVVTLSLAAPWVIVRTIRFTFDHVTLEGPLDLAGIVQEAQAASVTGEGLAGFLDTDLDVG